MTNNINMLRFLTFVRNDILPIVTQSQRGQGDFSKRISQVNDLLQ